GLIGIGMISCSEDFLEPGLFQTKKFEEGIQTTDDLHNLVNGVYDDMNTAEYYGRDMIIFGEVRSDNTNNDESTGRYINVGRFNMLANDAYAIDTWTNIYECLQQSNIAIHSDVTDEAGEADYYKGQAYTLRALFYFDLMRLYSTMFVEDYDYGVPIVTEFDKSASQAPPARSTLAETRGQIENDFEMALDLMDSSFDGTKTEISVDAAKALYSRYLLYIGNYEEAMNLAYEIIENPNYDYQYTAAPLYETQWENKETNESIFELAFTSSDRLNTTSVGYMWDPRGYGDFIFTDDLLGLYEENEARYPYTSQGFPMRYQNLNGTYNIRIIDYPEVVLNYAEAAFHEGDPNEDALSMLNELANARGAGDYADLNEENILTERRKELAGAGHRYFDLLRTEQDIPDVASQIAEPIPYGDERLAFPIPEDELDANPNIENQNPGY
ncbi:MAG: RagB/SusD family nutrient uptake outer membrane protein, partial [Bacteroidota bacterium]